MQRWNTIPFLSFFLVVLSLGQEHPIIETSLGKIKGHYKQSYNGRTYSAYEGIPYAKPPIGDLRFEAPVEPEPWTGIWEADIIHTCLQLFWITHKPIGSEDCLYLNVYVPGDKSSNNSNLDVIVHIHGGAFMVGDANLAGPLYLMDRDVIYVSMNYRLGALGFLSTEDDVVPGNNGMKDQVMALRWVQKHIHQFGGNPNSVTITGLSAGAGSVHLHYLSPLSKGLFHRGVSHGGTALTPWAIHEAPLAKAKRVAATISCDNSSTKKLVKCLKERPAIQVIKNSYESSVNGFPITPFAPVVEKQSAGAFLSDHPYKLLKSGEIYDVPWLTGSTTEEGIFGLKILNFKYDDLNKRWDTILSYVLDYNDVIVASDKTEVAQKIQKFYFDDKDISNDDIPSLIKLFSDRYFLLGLEKSVRMQAKVAKSPIYSYIYGYKQQQKSKFNYSNAPDDLGVDHGSDSHLLYDMKFDGVTVFEGELSESDLKIKEFLLDTITSFAKDNRPISNGIAWEPIIDVGDFKYLSIDNDGIKMDSKKEIAPAEFWESLPLSESGEPTSIKNEV